MGGAALPAAKGVDGVDPCLLSPAEAELLERDHLAARLVEARLFNDAQKGTVTEIQAAAAAREVLQLHSLERAAGGETAGTSGVVRQRVAFDVEAGGFVRRPAEADAMARSDAEAAEDEASRDRRRGVGVRPGGTEVPTNSVDAWEGQERAEHCDDEPDKGAMDLKLLEQVGGDVLFAHPPPSTPPRPPPMPCFSPASPPPFSHVTPRMDPLRPPRSAVYPPHPFGDGRGTLRCSCRYQILHHTPQHTKYYPHPDITDILLPSIHLFHNPPMRFTSATSTTMFPVPRPT